MVEETDRVLCRSEDFDTYIGRGRGNKHLLNTEPGERGWLGNPFKIKEAGGDYSREESIEKFREEFLKKIEDDEEFRESVKELKGQTLGGWCKKDEDCHGDIIIEWLNHR